MLNPSIPASLQIKGKKLAAILGTTEPTEAQIKAFNQVVLTQGIIKVYEKA